MWLLPMTPLNWVAAKGLNYIAGVDDGMILHEFAQTLASCVVSLLIVVGFLPVVTSWMYGDLSVKMKSD